MARGGQGAPAGPQLPPSRAGGGGRPSFPAQPTRRGKKARGRLSGEVKGLTFWAPGQQGQTPNTHLREEPAEPKPGLPALPTARTGARGGSAREGEPKGGSPHSPLPGPTAAGPGVRGARRSSCAERHNLSGPGGRRLEPSAAPRTARVPPAPAPLCEFPAAASAPAAGQDACAGEAARFASGAAPTCAAQAPAPAPARRSPTLGGSPGSLAAEPRLMLRREVAASPAAGGGCTGTRRGGEGARRPGPCSRGPARGCHLEARRRSRGTTGGGSGGDGSSST